MITMELMNSLLYFWCFFNCRIKENQKVRNFTEGMERENLCLSGKLGKLINFGLCCQSYVPTSFLNNTESWKLNLVLTYKSSK